MEETLTSYPLDVPITEEVHCRICAPVPKFYKRHGDLSKHLRRYHLSRLVFRCRHCNEIFETLKGCKAHQINCSATPGTTTTTVATNNQRSHPG
ncbi:hypothetical protein YQE_08689, partial [Dendroctonus ponderosae]